LVVHPNVSNSRQALSPPACEWNAPDTSRFLQGIPAPRYFEVFLVPAAGFEPARLSEGATNP
jgi:hypothetical protein